MRDLIRAWLGAATLVLVPVAIVCGLIILALWWMLAPLRDRPHAAECVLAESDIRAHTIKEHPIPGTDSTVPMPDRLLVLDQFYCDGVIVYVPAAGGE